MIRMLLIGFFAVCVLALSPAAQAQSRPVITDSRVKTLVYNENDVYSVLTHYGYQSNIEFHPKERIQTVVLGDRVNWQIIPSGRRLFIRPLEENLHTNMTVVTSERSYQFDLRSNAGGALKGDEELVYVVRFFYPEDNAKSLPANYASEVPARYTPPLMASSAFNYRYSFTGPDMLAPRKIYDDGQSTTIMVSRLPQRISVPTAGGKERPVASTQLPDGSLRVNIVAPELLLHYGADLVHIYNEAY
ncbi:MAG: TrbG/VirB9 family P-type conjugative transfer protein [Rickettsiales bacterium]|nr:TrbG/VirB9 family P-type conjugative transfer protein [Rickettsiales bacterium]